MKEKIGVYICHCGSNISDYVDVDKVRDEIEKINGVVLSKTTMFACADSTQREIKEDIEKNKLDGLVVASCSPTLHLPTFRNVALRAGLNPYNYIQVNIREQGSWAHSDDKVGATDKAIQMIKAGITKTFHSKALEPIKISALNSVAIIGAGIAGLRAARELAEVGTKVYLIEKDSFVGGRVSQWGKMCSERRAGESLIRRLYKKVEEEDNIDLFLNTEIKKISGNVGNFILEVDVHPRYIKDNAKKERLDKLIEELDPVVNDEYNFNIVKRKAIYKNYEVAIPDIPVIDLGAFDQKSVLVEKYKDCIDLNQKTEKKELNIGAVIVSTGFDPYEPEKGEYSYKENESIVTFQEFERIIELNHDKEFIYKGKNIKNIAYIYCVGSCAESGENQYCSRICCTRTIAVSTHLKEDNPEIQNYHLYRQIRTYGKQEIMFDDALKGGDIFMKFDDDDPPIVKVDNGKTIVTINDLLTDKETIELEPDLTVLVTGMKSRKDSKDISKILKIPVGRDKFFNEAHPKLRPVETVIDGVFIAGACQGPKSISESIKSALSAASKAYSLINKGEIELEPTLAKIDSKVCDGCGECFDVCPFNAIIKVENQDKIIAEINESSCKGCGICTPVCAVDAIDIIGYTNNEIKGMIDSLLDVE